MNHQEAIEKAKTPVQPAQPTSQPDPYVIPFEMGDAIKSLIGKTLQNPKNGTILEITDWVGQNYVVRVNRSDNDYTVTPAMYMWQMHRKFNEI